MVGPPGRLDPWSKRPGILDPRSIDILDMPVEKAAECAVWGTNMTAEICMYSQEPDTCDG